jgi:hypothetical protein
MDSCTVYSWQLQLSAGDTGCSCEFREYVWGWRSSTAGVQWQVHILRDAISQQRGGNNSPVQRVVEHEWEGLCKYFDFCDVLHHEIRGHFFLCMDISQLPGQFNWRLFSYTALNYWFL